MALIKCPECGHEVSTKAKNCLNCGCPVEDMFSKGLEIEDGTLLSMGTCADTNIKIPHTVTSIKNLVFENCKDLTSITIPNSVTSIGSRAFENCTSSSIIVEPNNEIYDSRDNCNAIIETATNTMIFGCKNTIIPTSVKSIKGSAFLGCTNLKSINIPNSITSIGGCAFLNCSSLTSIAIPNSVKCIGEGAFSGCSRLTSITVDPNNKKYDSRDNCNAIIETATNTLIAGCKNTIIPNSVTSIEMCAFEGCKNLTSINIPETVTYIGAGAFKDCTKLTSITIPNSVTTIGEYTFCDCSKLTSVTIPNSVTSIEASAFEGCKNLTSITIPDSVTSIEDWAFSGCKNLTSISVEPNNTVYDSREECNAIIETSSNTLIYACNNTTIPTSVTSIDWCAFDNIKNEIIYRGTVEQWNLISTNFGFFEYEYNIICTDGIVEEIDPFKNL